jgi:DNA-binding LacI/PurR family transcriptional regulator
MVVQGKGIKDMAKNAGVSIMKVSRYFNCTDSFQQQNWYRCP